MTAAAFKTFQKAGTQAMLENLYVSRKKQYQAGKITGTVFAMVCLRLGRKEEAIQLLYNDFDHHRGILSILVEPSFVELNGDPRYQELLHKIDFPSPPTVRFD